MLERYEDLGYKFENTTELVDLLNDNKDEAIYYESVDGSIECMVIEPDSATRFWYYKEKGEEYISGIDLHYAGETSFWIRNPVWSASKSEPKVRDSFGKLVPIRNQARPMVAVGGKGTTFCFNMVEAPVMADFSSQSKLKIAVTAFTEEARVFAEEVEETFIPLGMFSADGEADTPRATMTATITASVLQLNSYTGKFFYEIDVTTQGMEFTIVSSVTALKGFPKAGMKISGNFWLSGTVKEIMRK